MPPSQGEKGLPVEDEDEVADGAETTQDGCSGAQAEQPEAEGEAEAEREGRTPRPQEASHCLLLLHVCVGSLS